ncbi:MAG: NAD(P)-dependent glycerol-3-phosphate dehydrogenase [Hyphomicrobiales bacterium]|nr:NAD(P)-dependent glycerol-3-phosphate dehydrogenase [Hyphomicrobiales bacterium]
MSARFAVLGAGAWGTALANRAAARGAHVFLWAHDRDHVAAMVATRANDKRLPGVRLADSIEPTADLACVGAADHVLAVVPAQALRATARAARPFAKAGSDWIVCAKGVERGTHAFMSEVLAQETPDVAPAILSGPSFAQDVSAGLPTAVTLAAGAMERADLLCHALGGPTFRLYSSTDIRGVEVGGAGKNVLAIACGIAAGRGLGASAVAALTARGFAELARLAAACGGRRETLMGLSGLGDLVLSCGSAQSRNFAFGERLGAGASLDAASGGKLAEGVFTARALVELARARGVVMPISETVDQIVAGRIGVADGARALMMRPQKAEM